MRKSLSWRLILILVTIIGLPIIGYGQPGPPPDPDVPITGIEILLAGGALLGLKKLMGKSKQK